ncbi:MAG TPA: redoxin domain-containing protein [Gammaproteobacteria bacterium]|nr:redoxin domain-containing protein [Gammaproteobacteria bacterium]
MASVRPGQVVASFRLPDRDGREVSLWRYKQRQPVVLVLWEGADPGLLAGFAERYSDYRRLGAEVLAIAPRSAGGEMPYPMLTDANGRVTAALADERPAILVLDSFGELFARREGEAARRPDHEDLLDWVFFTQVQCEECGPHAENWPRREPG